MNPPEAPSPRARALRWLARREHSRAELERKLLREVHPEDDAARQAVHAALDDLAARGLLSDERAAESLVAARASRYGSLRLRQALQSRGLSPELVDSALQSANVAASELERARAIWQRKFGQPAPAGHEGARERARQSRFLAGRGFAPAVIRQVLRCNGQDEGDPADE